MARRSLITDSRHADALEGKTIKYPNRLWAKAPKKSAKKKRKADR